MLEWLRGLFAGRRCFVVGNGPSLRIPDLERIARNGDVTIASNKIFMAFDSSGWRPTLYTVADWCVAENNADVIRRLDVFKLFPEELQCYFGAGHPPGAGRTVFFRQIVPPHVDDAAYVSLFTDDIREGVFVGETITNLNIQIAAYLGCREIYLIGVDGTYVLPPTRQAHRYYSEVLVSEGERNHFHPDYRKPGETWSVPRPEAHERNYEKCRDELSARGILLANASRHSVVRALPRVDFDRLF